MNEDQKENIINDQSSCSNKVCDDTNTASMEELKRDFKSVPLSSDFRKPSDHKYAEEIKDLEDDKMKHGTQSVIESPTYEDDKTKHGTQSVIESPTYEDDKTNHGTQSVIESSTDQFRCVVSESDATVGDGIKRLTIIRCNNKLVKCSKCEFEGNQKEVHDHELKNHKENFVEVSECSDKLRNYGAIDGCKEVDEFMDDFEEVSDFIDDSEQLISEVVKVSYKCSQCKYKSKLRNRATDHSLIHAAFKIFKCSDCKYESNRRDKIREHLARVHKLKSTKIADRRYITTQDIDAAREISFSQSITQVAERAYKCTACRYLTEDKLDAERHLTVHSDIDLGLYRSSEIDPSRHELLFQQNKGTKYSKILESSYKTIKKMEVPTDGTHSTNRQTDIFKCSVCDYQTIKISRAKRHSLVHSESKLFLCPHCGFGANRSDNIRKHLEDSHGEQYMFSHDSVDLINKEIDIGTDISSKSIIEESGEAFNCSICRYQTEEKSDALKHATIHSTLESKFQKVPEVDPNTYLNAVNALQYKYYGAKFRNCFKTISKVSVRDSKSKTKHKCMYKCSVCNYQTGIKSRAKRHSLKHSDTKLFKCFLCSCEYSRGDKLRIHILNCHQININQDSKTPRPKNKTVARKSSRSAAKSSTNMFVSDGIYESEEESDVENYQSVPLGIYPDIEIKHEPLDVFVEEDFTEELPDESIFQEKHMHDDDAERSNVLIKTEETFSSSKSKLESELLKEIEESKYPIVLIKKLKMNEQDLVKCNQKYFPGTESNLAKSLLPNFGSKEVSELTKRFFTKVFMDEASNYILPQTNATTLMCSYCDFSTTLKSDLESHSLRHAEGSKVFKCTHCNYGTICENDFQLHLLIHPDQQFKCTECEYKTSCKKDFQVHILSHIERLKMILSYI